MYYHKSNFDLYIGPSEIPNAGLGVFTRNSIPSGTYIDDYYGELVEYICPGEYSFQIEDTLFINAENLPRCYMAMLNDASYFPTSKRALKRFRPHGLMNNCVFRVNTKESRVCIYSIVDILPDTELLVCYGDHYWID